MFEVISSENDMASGHKEQEDVLDFSLKFEVPRASVPSFLCKELFDFRMKFMHEELIEFRDSHLVSDMHGCADALVDLAYVVHGTALMMGIPWKQVWDEVQKKNMQKEKAVSAEQSKRGCKVDVIKPAGWTPPDHTSALGTGPWLTLEI